MMDRETDGYHAYLVSQGHGLRHNPLKAIIGPRPIGWISTVSSKGVGNLAPYSFFNMINDVPPMLAFSSNGDKDSVRNVRETGEFTVSITTPALAAKMNISSGRFAADVDEFEVAELAKRVSHVVGPVWVDGAAAALECVSTDIMQLRSKSGEMVDSWMVMAEIVAVHIDRTMIVDEMYDTAKAQPILRAGHADEYWQLDTRGKFRMSRPE